MAAAGLILVEHTPDNTPGLLDLLVFSSQWPPTQHSMPLTHDAARPLSLLPVPAVWKSLFTLDLHLWLMFV